MQCACEMIRRVYTRLQRTDKVRECYACLDAEWAARTPVFAELREEGLLFALDAMLEKCEPMDGGTVSGSAAIHIDHPQGWTVETLVVRSHKDLVLSEKDLREMISCLSLLGIEARGWAERVGVVGITGSDRIISRLLKEGTS